MAPPKPHHEYLANRVASATPLELTRMLFEGAVQAVREAIAAHRSGDILARGNAVTKAVQILGELRFSLRRDVAPQYCDTLSGLYGYLQNRLIQAHAQKSEGMLEEALELIQTLLDGWIGAMRNLSAEDSASAPAAEPPREPEPVPARAPAMTASNPYSSPESSTILAAEPPNRSWEF
jgi:flagellar secretion chaperone FliS